MKRPNLGTWGLVLCGIGTFMLAIGLPSLYQELPIPANRERLLLRRLQGNIYGGHESVAEMNRANSLIDNPVAVSGATTAGGVAFFAVGMFCIFSWKRPDLPEHMQDLKATKQPEPASTNP